jgi:ABC-type branched-subunit amino acid transport system permease subunit
MIFGGVLVALLLLLPRGIVPALTKRLGARRSG